MTDVTTKKAKAAAKMAFGALRMGGAAMTVTGHGLVGAALKQRGMMGMAARLGKLSYVGGKRMWDEGYADWQRADS